MITNTKIDNTDTFEMAGVSVNTTVTANAFVGDGANLTNLPDATGIVDDTIVNDDINANADIAFTKLANLIGGNILVGNGSSKATSVTLSGDAALSNSGAITIANNVINNAKIDNTDSFILENVSVNSTVSASMMIINVTDAASDGVEIFSTNPGNNASLLTRVNGNGSGDPMIAWSITGEGGFNGFSMGVDNNDSNKLKISRDSSNININTALTIDTAANIGIGTTSPFAKLSIQSALTDGHEMAITITGNNNIIEEPIINIIRLCV